MVEFLVSYGWIIWIALVLLFLTLEMFTLDFTFLMISLGSVLGLAVALFGADWYVQILVAAIGSALLIFTLRPPLLKRLRRGADPAKSNIPALIGLGGAVVAPLSVNAGQVKLANGDTWTARLSPAVSSRDIGLGEPVVVVAIEGATAFVVPQERTAQ